MLNATAVRHKYKTVSQKEQIICYLEVKAKKNQIGNIKFLKLTNTNMAK